MSEPEYKLIKAEGQIIPLPPEWPVAETLDDGKEKWLKLQTWRAFKGVVARELRGHVHIIGMYDRPGVLLFSNELEHRYFWPPGSVLNDRLRVHRCLWENMEWLICSIPRKVQRFGPKVAQKLGLQLAEGFPTVLEIQAEHLIKAKTKREIVGRSDWAKPFPIHGDNVFTIEYPKGSPLADFASGPVGWQLLRSAELSTIMGNSRRAREEADRN
jgi:hypothetical protein